MTSNRLKHLAKLRLILSVIALLLAVLMIVSGVMLFIVPKPEPPTEIPPQYEGGTTIIPLQPKITEATEAPTEAATEPTLDPDLLAPEEYEKEEKPRDQWPGNQFPQKPDTQNPDTQDPNTQAPDNQAPDNQVPDSQTPDNQAPDNQTPDNQTPDNQTPDNQAPDNQAPDTQTPDTQTPDNQTPDNQAPDNQAPDNQAPDTQTPDTQTPETPAPADANTVNVSASADVTNMTEFATEDTSAVTEPAETVVTEPAETAATEPAETAATEYTEAGETKYIAPDTTELTTNHASSEYRYIANAQTEQAGVKDNNTLWGILFWSSTALLAVDLAAILFVSSQIKNEQERLQEIRRQQAETEAQARRNTSNTAFTTKRTPHTDVIRPASASPQVATIHQIGRRDYQQDSSGHTAALGGKGLLAVLADGMGGLSGGEKVSQKIVMDMLAMAAHLQSNQVNGVLWKMLDKVNENVNQMLGPDGLYKSGSTMVAILAFEGQFQWIAVGDSRIYLYRQGYANQLNHDHDHLQTQMADVLSGRLTMEEALHNPDSRKLTSFIGMGQLKYVDGSRNAIALEPGDRLVLMSDGVYNIVNENFLAEVLKNYKDVEQAAAVIERIVRDANHPHQDNYTAIVLGF